MKHTYLRYSKLALGLSLAFFTGSAAMAQQLENAGATIVVGSGTQLIIGNSTTAVDFINETGGTVENNGTISVTGDWVNNDAGGVFSTNAGTVNLNGVFTSDIEGSQITNFYNLNLTNGRKRLDGVNTRVNNVLDITGSSMELNSQTLLVENSSPSAITSSSGYIISETGPSAGYGVVDWNIGNITGTYTVPFGTDEVTPTGISFDYDIVSTGTGASMGRVEFSTYPTTDHTTNLPWPTGVQHVSDDYGQDNWQYVLDRYWVIDNNFQSLGFSTWPRVDYTLRYDDDDWSLGDNNITEANLVAQRYNDIDDKWLDWLYSDLVNASTNSVTVILTNSEDFYDVWTLVDNSDPLPVELVKLTAQCESGRVLVNWTTASETNNDYFTVERSQDGTFFDEVAVVDGAGTSNEMHNYSVYDDAPYSGVSYYRIKQTDFDGEVEYSDLIATNCENSDMVFEIVTAYDNGSGGLNVAFNAADGEVFTATLFDMQGKLMMEESGRAYAGTNQVALNVANYSRGIYLLTLRNEHKTITKRVMLN